MQDVSLPTWAKREDRQEGEQRSMRRRTGPDTSQDQILELTTLMAQSHLQTEISLSTLEAEYSALSSSMRTLLPLRSMLIEIIEGIKLPHIFQSTVKCQVFEDNNGALLLATKQRITNRTKYFQVKWHFFWSHVRDGTIQIVKVDTQEQWADFLTKGLSRESFERVRKLVQGW